MKVAQLCLSPDFGGLELLPLRFGAWLREAGVETILVAAPDTRLARAAREAGLPVHPFPRPRGPLPVLAARRLRRLLREAGITHLHAHWKYDLPLAALARRGGGFRLVFSRQMDLPGSKRDPYHRLLYGAVDRFHVITRRLAEQARAHLPLPAERIETVYYGVPAPPAVDRAALKAELGLAPTTFLAGIVGRLAPAKGQHLLIDAVAELVAQGRDVHALVVGHPMDPAYPEALRQRARERGVAARIHFRDFHPRPQELMAGLDCLVLASRAETFGLVLPEAMRAGTAVIGTDAGGVPEIIDPGRTGLLVPPEDAAALARALATLQDDPALRARLAAAGRQEADARFDRDRQFTALLDLLRRA